jgi:hypothetical protein
VRNCNRRVTAAPFFLLALWVVATVAIKNDPHRIVFTTNLLASLGHD